MYKSPHLKIIKSLSPLTFNLGYTSMYIFLHRCNLTWGMFSRGMADSSWYTFYKRSVWLKIKTIKLRKYFSCRNFAVMWLCFVICCARKNTFVSVKLTLLWVNMNENWKWSVTFDNGSYMKFQQNTWNLSWNVCKSQMMALKQTRLCNWQYHRK